MALTTAAEIYGREVLLEAQRKQSEAAVLAAEATARGNFDARAQALSLLMLEETIAAMGSRKNSQIFGPSKRKAHHERFKREMALPDSYEADRLLLKAKGDQASRWMDYTLCFKQTEDLTTTCEPISRFRASDGLPNYPWTQMTDRSWPTGLGVWEEDDMLRPVTYKSPEYEFIKNVTGLFMPSVVRGADEFVERG